MRPLPASVRRPFLACARGGHHLLRGLAELILPATCAGCGALTDEDEPFCALCARTLDPILDACPRCALALPAIARDGERAPPVACLACQRSPPAWRFARAPFAYAGELASAIRRFKLGPDLRLARPLARLLAPSLALVACDALVPVPLHPRRLRKREFNQASLLARGARHRRGPPVWEALDRVRDTPAQGTLDAAARRANMRGAFAIPKRERARIRGAALCLVDDVITTGATATACAEALLRSGARSVDVLALARTLP